MGASEASSIAASLKTSLVPTDEMGTGKPVHLSARIRIRTGASGREQF